MPLSPNLLSIECSSREMSICVMRGDGATDSLRSESFARQEGLDRAGTSALLAPMIATALQNGGIDPGAIDLIAVTNGPGSFTGLRVGIVTARVLAYVTDSAIVAVNTLEAIAMKTSGSMKLEPGKSIAVVINAQRQQLFGGTFRVVESEKGTKVEPVNEMQLFDRDAWIESLSTGTVVSGTGLKPLTALSEKSGITVGDQSLWQPDAETVGRIGLAKYNAGVRDDIWALEPVYFRPSYADERLAGKPKS